MTSARYIRRKKQSRCYYVAYLADVIMLQREQKMSESLGEGTRTNGVYQALTYIPPPPYQPGYNMRLEDQLHFIS